MIPIVFMNYVLAGSAYLAAHSVFRGRTNEESPLAELLRDWMPFMLSAAITAGIAPLSPSPHGAGAQRRPAPRTPI